MDLFILDEEEDEAVESSSFDFEYYGFPKNALTLYQIDSVEFRKVNDDEKKKMLIDG